MHSGTRTRRLLLGLALCVTAPLLLGFLCFPLVAPPPSGVVTPTPAASFSPLVSAIVANTATNATSNIQANLSVPDGHTLPIGAVFYIPAGWSVATGGDITDGSIVGSLAGSVTVADPLFFSCDTTVDFDPGDIPPSDIKLLDASTDASPGNQIAGSDTDGNGKPQVVEDTDPVNGRPDGVDKYPAFLDDLLPATPRARYFGAVEAAGLSDLYVNVVVYEVAAGGPYQVITLVNDPMSPPESSTVQFCAPQSFTLTLNGTSGAQTVYRNPVASGVYTFGAALVSEFDLDNDGVSNGLDDCPATANATQTDADQDYLGDPCDSNDAVANFDADGDGVENGYDNCMFVDNAPPSTPLDDQLDSDFDDIGNVCDASPGVPSGPNYYLSCTDPVGIGQGDPGGASCVQGTPTPIVMPTATPSSKDPNGDTDGDTVPNDTDLDDDGDGCPDTSELSSDPGQGGLRDPHNPWDYFNPTKDGQNRVGDILLVVGQYFQDAFFPGGEPNPNYTTQTDRSYLGPNAWNLGPPNGQQRVDDVIASVNQYFHDCA